MDRNLASHLGIRSSRALRAALGRGKAYVAAGQGGRLARHLGSWLEYRRVKQRTSQRGRAACNRHVGFVVAALRDVEVIVPDGRGPAAAAELSRFLAETLAWRRVTAAAELSPGDLVFTEAAPCCPGLPAHVYVFMGWADRDGRVAYIADHLGFLARHPLRSQGRFSGHDPATRSPAGFAYALRG